MITFKVEWKTEEGRKACSQLVEDRESYKKSKEYNELNLLQKKVVSAFIKKMKFEKKEDCIQGFFKVRHINLPQLEELIKQIINNDVKRGKDYEVRLI